MLVEETQITVVCSTQHNLFYMFCGWIATTLKICLSALMESLDAKVEL